MVTRWWSTFKLVERVIKLEAPLKLMFQDEFRHRTSANQPTLLEAFELTDDDFDGLCAILHVLKPLSLAQKALEGDQYVNISLVPLAVGACQVIADPETEADLYILIDKILEDFNSRWRYACYYMPITTCGVRHRQVGISTYHFWAMLLDPCRKMYIARVLPYEINRERLRKDCESACVEIVRINFQNTEREPQQQEPVQYENQSKKKKLRGNLLPRF